VICPVRLVDPEPALPYEVSSYVLLNCATGQVAHQVEIVRQRSSDLDGPIELAFNFLQVSIDDPDDFSVVRQLLPGSSDRELRRLATVLDGSISMAVRRIRLYYEEFGISYFTLHMPASATWKTMERIAFAVR